MTAEVARVFNGYPNEVRPRMDALRSLILETAHMADDIGTVTETLKWGEPSYISKSGTTIRIDWKPGAPRQYALYYSCNSLLGPTFQTVYRNTFQFEGNRALIFQVDEEVPLLQLQHCILTALRYHKLKKLPLLGM